MADHYGDAELVIRYRHASSGRPITASTKWYPPESGDKSFERAEATVSRGLGHLQQSQIPLPPYHVWDYGNDTYLYNLVHLQALQKRGCIAHIGLANVDAARLELLQHSGFSIATNQVSCSVIDRRLIHSRLAAVCQEHGVGMLAYGSMLGGFLTEQLLGREEPRGMEGLNWSLRR